MANGERSFEYARWLACHDARSLSAPRVRVNKAARHSSDQVTDTRVGDLRGTIAVRVRQ